MGRNNHTASKDDFLSDTVNGGRTWAPVSVAQLPHMAYSGGADMSPMSFTRHSGWVVLQSVHNYLLHTAPPWSHWTVIGRLPSSAASSATVTFSTSDYGVAIGTLGTAAAIFATRDAGRHWNAWRLPAVMNFPGAALYLTGRELWVQAGSHLFHSVDGGRVWSEINVNSTPR